MKKAQPLLLRQWVTPCDAHSQTGCRAGPQRRGLHIAVACTAAGPGRASNGNGHTYATHQCILASFRHVGSMKIRSLHTINYRQTMYIDNKHELGIYLRSVNWTRALGECRAPRQMRSGSAVRIRSSEDLYGHRCLTLKFEPVTFKMLRSPGSEWFWWVSLQYLHAFRRDKGEKMTHRQTHIRTCAQPDCLVPPVANIITCNCHELHFQKCRLQSSVT